jgi:hypothetical protein
MGIEWFRSWHGAPTDNKWLMIARRADVPAGVVSAVVWALFDYASQNENRGSVEGFDVETYATFSGFDEAKIAAVIAALTEKNVIVSGVLSAWQRRQPKREDNSTERVRQHRNAMKRDETHGNARVDKEKEKKVLGADAPTPLSKSKRVSSAIPEGFALDDAMRKFAGDRGFVGVNVERMFERFSNHHRAKGSRFADWHAAWRTWVGNQVEFDAQRNTPQQRRIPDV